MSAALQVASFAPDVAEDVLGRLAVWMRHIRQWLDVAIAAGPGPGDPVPQRASADADVSRGEVIMRRQRLFPLGLTIRAVGVSVSVAALLLAGAEGAVADTHTGYVVEITCNGVTTTYVTPTSPAAAAQDVSSTAVAVLSYGAYLVPDHFPAGKVVYCDLDNLTTGSSYTDLPFLVVGAP
jgi:hypothetical protein